MTRTLFFNYATVSPITKTVYKAVGRYWDEFYQVGPPDVLYKYDPLVDDLAQEAATLIGCTADEITCVKNTTEGIVIASETLPVGAHDEILVLGEEYPANLLPWLKRQRDGVTVRVIPHLHGAEAADMLLQAITPRTKIVAVSSAQYYDGYMADLKKLSDAAHAVGAYFVVDAVQSIGIRALDVSKVKIDMLACGGQKFLQAGPGIGFLYINRAILGDLRDFKPGIRSMRSFSHTGYTLKDTAERFGDGTQNLAGIVALHASLKELNKKGIASVEAASRQKLVRIKAILKKRNIPYIDHGERQSNIVAIPAHDPMALATYLRNRGVILKPIKDIVRLSFSGQTKLRDVETAAQVIAEALKVLA